MHAEPDGEAIAILKVAMAKEKDRAALDQALAELDALVAKRPKDAEAHYARGWVLSRLERPDPAVAAYDKAFELDKKLADAAYNAGVVLARSGKGRDAAVRFDRALAADPKHVDAAYNAGQSYYDAKQFAKAAERWTTAAKLAPDDFNAAKKLVQAYMALGKDAEAAKAREKVLALKQAAKDPQLAKLSSWVFDQFDVGKYHIYVYEAFDTSGDLAYVYRFQVTEHDRPLGSVNLETSAVIREQGVPFILGMDKGGTHTSFSDKTWKTMPTYRIVKAEAIKKIAASF
ncbi:MAG TPA: tetratricopeptide repeat protein [Kofleriaceae bacterium]|nr:tetratricopeptide repeat protein [Kofleriaceae bacterium]